MSDGEDLDCFTTSDLIIVTSASQLTTSASMGTLNENITGTVARNV
jgi:hypothetical protein